jgi:hypothetical protein
MFDNLQIRTREELAREMERRQVEWGWAEMQAHEAGLRRQVIEAFIDKHFVEPTDADEHELERMLARARKLAIN